MVEWRQRKKKEGNFVVAVLCEHKPAHSSSLAHQELYCMDMEPTRSYMDTRSCMDMEPTVTNKEFCADSSKIQRLTMIAAMDGADECWNIIRGVGHIAPLTQ